MKKKPKVEYKIVLKVEFSMLDAAAIDSLLCIPECPTTCKSDYKPVCAINVSTGKEKTCPNLCQFKKMACQMKKSNIVLSFRRYGPCSKLMYFVK